MKPIGRNAAPLALLSLGSLDHTLTLRAVPTGPALALAASTALAATLEKRLNLSQFGNTHLTPPVKELAAQAAVSTPSLAAPRRAHLWPRYRLVGA